MIKIIQNWKDMQKYDTKIVAIEKNPKLNCDLAYPVENQNNLIFARISKSSTVDWEQECNIDLLLSNKQRLDPFSYTISANFNLKDSPLIIREASLIELQKIKVLMEQRIVTFHSKAIKPEQIAAVQSQLDALTEKCTPKTLYQLSLHTIIKNFQTIFADIEAKTFKETIPDDLQSAILNANVVRL